MPENKVRYGIENVYYAVVTELNGVVSYGTPKHEPGAVALIKNPTSEELLVHGDNIEWIREEINNGYDGSLEMVLISDQFRQDVFGETLDANGALVENKSDVRKKIALIYQFENDLKRTRFVDYNVFVSRPTLESSTKTKTKDVKTDKLNIAVRPAIDTGDLRGRLQYGDTGYDTFFTAVYLKSSVVNTVASATAAFSKAAPADISINVTSPDGTNAVKNVLINGASIPGVSLTATGVDVVIAQAYVAALVNGVYILMVELNKGNAVTVTLTVAA